MTYSASWVREISAFFLNSMGQEGVERSGDMYAQRQDGVGRSRRIPMVTGHNSHLYLRSRGPLSVKRIAGLLQGLQLPVVASGKSCAEDAVIHEVPHLTASSSPLSFPIRAGFACVGWSLVFGSKVH